MLLKEFGHLARSGTIWARIIPWCRYGELFSEVVLWPAPVTILAPREIISRIGRIGRMGIARGVLGYGPYKTTTSTAERLSS